MSGQTPWQILKSIACLAQAAMLNSLCKHDSCVWVPQFHQHLADLSHGFFGSQCCIGIHHMSAKGLLPVMAVELHACMHARMEVSCESGLSRRNLLSKTYVYVAETRSEDVCFNNRVVARGRSVLVEVIFFMSLLVEKGHLPSPLNTV